MRIGRGKIWGRCTKVCGLLSDFAGKCSADIPNEAQNEIAGQSVYKSYKSGYGTMSFSFLVLSFDILDFTQRKNGENAILPHVLLKA